MIIDGSTIVDKKLVTFNEEYPLIDTDKQIQPNGLDLRINKLYSAQGKVEVPRDTKVKAELSVLEEHPKDGWFTLYPNTSLYWVDFLESANIADGFCAQLITRSSLVRAGLDVVAGLWDTGWTGPLGCTLRVRSPINIEWGAKLCQIVFFKAQFRGKRYEGSWQGLSQTAIAE